MKPTWKRVLATLLTTALLLSLLLVPVGAAAEQTDVLSDSGMLTESGEEGEAAADGGEALPDDESADNQLGEQPTDNEQGENQPEGDENLGEQPEGDETLGEQPEGDETLGDQPEGDETLGEQPEGDETLGEQPEGDEALEAQAEGDETGAPVIPGYTLFTGETLDLGKYYIIVTQSTDKTLYALYASEAGKDVGPGALTGADGACTAVLTVADGAVSAVHLQEAGDGDLVMSSLHFEAYTDGNEGYAFKANDLYLLLTSKMFADGANYLSAANTDGVWTISSGSRVLSFNKKNDALAQFRDHITDFWGPGKKGDQFKIYLYTCDEQAVDAAACKTALEAEVTKVKDFQQGDYVSGWDSFAAALEAAQQILAQETGAADADSLKRALGALVTAEEGLESRPTPEAPPEGATIIDGRGAPESGTTTGQPFDAGTAGSNNFRIPALITLSDGTLVAACDARWNHAGDACALDTILSYSTDNGKTWNYSFPNYFNDSTDAKHSQATAFIDPLIISGKDDTIYLMVDLFPGGIALNTAPNPPHAASGFVDIDGVQRMAIYLSTSNQTDENYLYYVGDFTEGFAPILEKNGNAASSYFVDDHYNLYYGENKEKIYCPQLGSDNVWVQQNVFYYEADLHARNACYLWLVKSTDGGKTWSAPTILNPQVRTGEHQFYGVGPGAGLCLDDGTIMLPCYTFKSGPANSAQIASFVYSTDGGVNWTRSQDSTDSSHWSSESALVQIDENTVRHFYRDGYKTLYYTDHTRSGSTWTAGDPVDTGVPNTWNNQLSAIRYSQLIDGKPAILVSTAASGSNARTHGKIYTFLLNEDKTLTLGYTFDVTDGKYAYSSLTELADGSIGLLYENNDAAILYENYTIGEVANGAVINGKSSISVPLYKTFEDVVSTAPTEEELRALDSTIVSVSVNGNTVTYTGLKEGTTTYTSNGITITVTVAPDEITELTLKAGESKTIRISSETLQREPDSAIAGAVITSVDNSKTEAGILGDTANEDGYTDSSIPLTQALFQFEAVEGSPNTYIASGKTSDGKTVYLNFKDWVPSSTQSSTVTLELLDRTKDFALKCGSYYLYFFRNNPTMYTRVDSGSAYYDGCSFQLFRPVEEGETSSEALPGFIKINALEEVEGGKSYLIAMKYGLADYYFVRPSDNTEADYPHLLKLTPIINHSLTITGKSAGKTDLMVDDMIYRVTVTGGSSSGGGSGGGSGSTTTTPSNPTTPSGSETVTTTPDAAVSNGAATSEVTAAAAKDVVDQAVKNNSSEVVVKPDISGDVDSVEVTLPGTMVEGVSGQTNATLKIDTPVVQVSIPNQTLGELSGAAVTVTAQRQGNVLDFSIRAGEQQVKDLSGNMTVTVPVSDCGPGTVAVIITDSGERQVVRKSIADSSTGVLNVPLNGSARLELLDNSKTFSDVPESNWAADAVAFVSSRELFNGTTPSTFSPNQSMTRGMLAVVLHNLENNPKDVTANSFSDVGSSWYTEAISWAADRGIVSGYPNGSFQPNTPITREQLAVMLWRYAGQPSASGSATGSFVDADKISEFAADAMDWAVSKGVINGKGGGILDPKGQATRSQVAQMLMNFMSNVK